MKPSSDARARVGGRPSRRSEMLAAALDLYTQQGVAAIRTADIARATGMTGTAVGYHFPNTDALLHALLDDFLDELERAIKKHPLQALSTDDARALLRDYFEVLIDHLRVAILTDNDPSLQAHPDFGGRLRKANERVRRAISGARPTTERRAAAVAAIGSLWRPLAHLKEVDLRRTSDAIVQVAIAGLNSDT